MAESKDGEAVARKLTVEQQRALRLAVDGDNNTIVAAGGGYWVAAGTPELQRAALVRGDKTILWPPSVGTRTVYACERLGLFACVDEDGVPNHRARRQLTSFGEHVWNHWSRSRVAPASTSKVSP